MSKNYYVRNPDVEVLKVLAEEYQSMGRDTKIDGNTLTVYATRQNKPEPKKKKFSRDNRRTNDSE